MRYYIFFGFMTMIGIVLSRLNSAYHHELLFKRHINIRNEKLQKLFIWQSDPFLGHNDNKKSISEPNDDPRNLFPYRLDIDVCILHWLLDLGTGNTD